ncbi:MAG: ABC transporter substrate-binding protein [Geminicoccaceae bacterium]|nr:MAG: ABC transporter substrate-binding protein [Geminicoccaceae bacterium]
MGRAKRAKGRVMRICVAVLAVGLGLAGPAFALDRVTFGTNWKAQAEHGGYYQALATGIYEEFGLDVVIRQGGPQINHGQLLAAGRVDFNMGGSKFTSFNYVYNRIPAVTVAAIFQKEPQVLLAHPGVGIESFEDLHGRTLLLGAGGRATFWLWLESVFGLDEAQIQPYTFNPAPFIADPNKVQQGFVTSEPFAIQREGGFEPVVLMMADAGYDTYSTTIDVMQATIDRDPDLVQRFVDASILGWVSYLYGDPTPANELIKADNPDMTDEQLAFSRAKMLEYGIVDSGDALELGIGAMTDERWESFFQQAVEWGVYPADLDFRSAYTLDFVNRGVGLDLKAELLGQ